VLAVIGPLALSGHRVTNLLAKLPERERERVRVPYWQALDEAIDARDGKRRLQAIVDQLDKADAPSRLDARRRSGRACRAPAPRDPTPPQMVVDQPAQAITG
jgi:hypothetical protein